MTEPPRISDLLEEIYGELPADMHAWIYLSEPWAEVYIPLSQSSEVGGKVGYLRCELLAHDDTELVMDLLSPKKAYVFAVRELIQGLSPNPSRSIPLSDASWSLLAAYEVLPTIFSFQQGEDQLG